MEFQWKQIKLYKIFEDCTKIFNFDPSPRNGVAIIIIIHLYTYICHPLKCSMSFTALFLHLLFGHGKNKHEILH